MNREERERIKSGLFVPRPKKIKRPRARLGQWWRRNDGNIYCITRIEGSYSYYRGSGTRDSGTQPGMEYMFIPTPKGKLKFSEPERWTLVGYWQ